MFSTDDLLALSFGGHALAHALWSIHDTAPDELLVPLSMRVEGGRVALDRYEAPTQSEAIAAGLAAMGAHDAVIEAEAFAREVHVRTTTGESDAILVTCRIPRTVRTLELILGFARAEGRRSGLVGRLFPGARVPFRLTDGLRVLVEGEELTDDARRIAVEAVAGGIEQHEAAARLWPAWVAAGRSVPPTS